MPDLCAHHAAVVAGIAERYAHLEDVDPAHFTVRHTASRMRARCDQCAATWDGPEKTVRLKMRAHVTPVRDRDGDLLDDLADAEHEQVQSTEAWRRMTWEARA